MSMLDEWASTRTTEECEATLTRANVPCSRYFTVREALRQPHFEERESFAQIDDGAGPLKVPNPAFKFEQAAATARNYVPALGADNAGVLSSVLGYSKDRIASLYEKRILRSENNRF
jgi:crotonobetainyl-CoA:carnitine CoA-transferase CaiB-like acyl-CoA transferase